VAKPPLSLGPSHPFLLAALQPSGVLLGYTGVLFFSFRLSLLGACSPLERAAMLAMYRDAEAADERDQKDE
jgi:hypothetical protein